MGTDKIVACKTLAKVESLSWSEYQLRTVKGIAEGLLLAYNIYLEYFTQGHVPLLVTGQGGELAHP